MNYPEGVPDRFEYVLPDDETLPEWQSLDIEGSWFPEAFIGTMASLMRYANGETDDLPTSVEDAIETMATRRSRIHFKRSRAVLRCLQYRTPAG